MWHTYNALRLAALATVLLAGCNLGGDGGSDDAVASVLDPFDETVLSTYEVEMAPADWDAIVANPADNAWRPATVTWRGQRFEQVAVRPSGDSSRIPANPKPSLRLSFDELVPGRSFNGHNGLKLDSMLDDPSMLRERLAYGVNRSFGVAAPRMAHARLVVNGDYKGLYAAEQRPNKGFVTARFGEPVSQLWKFNDAWTDVQWLGSDPLLYVPAMFEPRIETLAPDEIAIRDWMDGVHNHVADLPEIFDIERFLDVLAVEIVTGELDGYNGGPYPPGSVDVWTGDFFLYKPAALGRFVMIPWDRDQAYSRRYTMPVLDGYDLHILTSRLVLGIPENLARLKEKLRQLIDGVHRTADMQARLDAIHAQIRDAALEDTKKPVTNDFWIEAVDWTRVYIGLRNDAIRVEIGP